MKSNDELFKKYVIQFSLIAIAYILMLNIFGSPTNYIGEIRVADCLISLSALTPAAIPGLLVGWLLGSSVSGCAGAEVLWGMLVMLLGCSITYSLKGKPPYVSLIPTMLINTVFMTILLDNLYGCKMSQFPLFVKVLLGEAACCIFLGCVVYYAVKLLSGDRR